MAFEKIYGLLIESALLLPAHQKELGEKRGFSDATIAKEKFRSGGKYLIEFEKKAFEMLGRGELIESEMLLSGVFVHNKNRMQINPVLLEETTELEGKKFSNILIPYWNAAGECEMVRPHKLGFKDVDIKVYQTGNLKDRPAEIILTEGEFKAVAGMQMGIPTIAIPGISSFSEKRFPELQKVLFESGVQRVIIMFDNETKDNPSITSRYKDNPNERYDTQFYAYYMASKLEKAGINNVVIATLPESWKIDGKIDIDGALSQLKMTGDLKKVMYDARPRLEYLHGLEIEAKQIVLRKTNQKYHKSRVRREFNKYVVTRKSGKNEWEETISNFVMKVLATHETPDGIKREVEFINEFGRRSNSFTIDSKDMSSADAFRTFSLSRGDFVWRGRLEDLLTIWESEFLMMDEGRYIVESDHLGWLEREKVWLFGNVAIREDGKELRPDANGIFWMEKRGIKIIPITVGQGRHAGTEGIPHLHLTPFDVKEIKNKLSESIGENEACVMLGWITAVAFMEEIFSHFRSFPFFFVTGKWQSGKSTVAEWMTNFFGIEEAGKSISQTTAVAIQRSLSYYSALPVYLDEYRNTKDIAYKNGFLRNVYNRQGAGKGVKDSSHGLRDAKVRGTLLLAGEETPKDGAILSRCIVVFVSRAKRLVNHFNWFTTNRAKFSYHFYDILKRKNELVKPFMRILFEWKEKFTKQGIQDRVALNYAIIVAGHAIVFGETNLDFVNWMLEETKLIQDEQSEEQAVNIFLEDLGAMKTRGLINDDYWHTTGGKVYLYFHGLHQIWSQEYRKSRGEESFKEGSIRAYLKEEKGFLFMNEAHRINGDLKKCVVFDASKCDETILNLVATRTVVTQ